MVFFVLKEKGQTKQGGVNLKKIDWREVRAYVILTILVCVLGEIIFLVNYVEENYEISNYLWIFNVVVAVSIPVYYFIYSKIEKRKNKKIEDSVIIKNIDFKYYRDIIEEYSPAMQSFLFDGIERKKFYSKCHISYQQRVF